MMNMHYLVFLICMWVAVIFLIVYGFRPNYFTEICLWLACFAAAAGNAAAATTAGGVDTTTIATAAAASCTTGWWRDATA